MRHRFQPRAMRLIAVFAIAAATLSLAIAVLTGCGSGAAVDSGTQTSAAQLPAPAVTSAAGSGTGQGNVAYRFAVCGDNRTVGIESGVLGRIIDSANANGAAFMVDTGDVTGGGSRDELTEYRDYTEQSGLKFYTVPGNHDVGSGGTSAAYEEIIGPTWYSFDYAGDHFIIVDNADDETGIPDDEMSWLTGELAANAGRRNDFIFAHIPVSSVNLPSGHATGEEGAAGAESGKRLVDEASKYDNVHDIFFGHIHAYLNYRLNGIEAYVTGGAGAPLIFNERQGGYYHYLLVSVKTDGSVDVEVVKV